MQTLTERLKRAHPNALLSLFSGPPAMMQIAALCYRPTKNGHEILLVRSRRGGRWIIPKGWPMANKRSDQVAAIEAWEEGGVKGKVNPVPIGTYHYKKSLGMGASLPCRASAYALRVEEEFEDYPEKADRKRTWLSPQAASEKVSCDSLAKLILNNKLP